MFGALTQKLNGVFSGLARTKRLTEENISDAVREVRLALLEADVNYGVTTTLVKRLKEKAVGEEVLKSVSPGQLFIKIVHDELVALMGGGEEPLAIEGKQLAVVMLCGLQGSGKTTHCAKLALFLRKQGKAQKPLLVACDLQRPAAILQLQTLGEQIQVPVFVKAGAQDPTQVAREALAHARAEGYDLMIVDTAGRLAIDEELMLQLEQIRNAVQPDEVLFVANATTGQDAVKTAKTFHDRIAITGSILTMLDGDARAGAAISIREVTGKPLKFEGIGEKIGDLQAFHPKSMADRILGMGDTINLVRKAQEHFDQEQSEQLEEKIRKATFTYEDYLNQMQAVKKMGSFKKLLGMLPGMGAIADLPFDEKEFTKVEAIIQSMTPDERRERCELVPSRRRRIAQGSGTTVDAVNRLLKSFRNAKKMFKSLPGNKKQLEKMFGGNPWH